MESRALWKLVFPRLANVIEAGISPEYITEFCKVSSKTSSEWIRNVHRPGGDALLRLWYLLRELGEKSPEIERLDPFVRTLGELFAFDVISALEAQEISGQTSPSVSQVYVTMRGSAVMRARFTVVELDELYGEKLAQKRLEVHVIAPTTNVEPILEEDEPAEVVRSESPVTLLPAIAGQSEEVTVSYGPDAGLTLASLLGAAGPLAKRLNESGTPEDRSNFRELIGMETLFELSNHLNALCSERARGMAR